MIVLLNLYYFEILIDASLELVQERDPRGLYAKAKAGQMPDIVGIDVPWHKPQTPDLILDPSSGDSVETMADQIIAEVPSLKEVMN